MCGTGLEIAVRISCRESVSARKTKRQQRQMCIIKAAEAPL